MGRGKSPSDRIVSYMLRLAPLQDKSMMERWGLEGMRSFEQVNVAKKEGERLAPKTISASSDVKPAAKEAQLAAAS